ncbi:hypothetical protein EI94DRAFT_1787843 [Lactarius quietus]|nr:hypothetical protein EI94DRAFT_1787843 [Lactarius quietus]
MFGTTSFMFILGIIALVLVTTIMFLEMAPSGGPVFPCYYAWGIITRLMYIICDIICAWRTVVLWNRDKRVITILIIFILGTTVAAVFQVLFGFGGMESRGRGITVPGIFDLVMAGPTLVTNLLSTGLIVWKAWQRRISVGKHLFERSGFVRTDRIFALFIESGLIYCCIWVCPTSRSVNARGKGYTKLLQVFYLISLFGVIPNPGFTLMALVSGLYPTIIVILVRMQMSPAEHYERPSTGMPFASGPAPGLTRYDSIPQHGVSIHRE